jgi:hypothetical protein
MTSGEPGAVLAIEMLPLAAPALVGPNVTVNVAVCPGTSVCGESVLMLNPAPLALAPLIERLAVPEFVSVTFTVAVFPTKTPPKLMLEGFALSVACVPVPLNEITSGEFVAVELIVMLPETVPAALGANAAVRVAVAPAAIVCPPLIPLELKPAPADVTLLIVIVEFPEFVNVMVCGLLLPTTTLPKSKLPGLAPKVLPAATALPVMVKVCGDP